MDEGNQVLTEAASERGRQMESRVLRSAADAGVSTADLPLLGQAIRAAMRPREMGAASLPSDQHPAFLHPGRTVLVLLGDVEETDVWILAVGALAESRDASLRTPPEAVEELVRDAAGIRPVQPGRSARADEALQLWNALPEVDWRGSGSPRDDELLEQLVSAPETVLRVALAEALDQVRHAHLWDSRIERVRAKELTQGVFGPLAARVSSVLDRRFAWWIRRVGSQPSRFT